MKSKEMKQALWLIDKVLTDPRVGPDHGDQLRKARRELATVARSGKVDQKRIFRAVEKIAMTMQQIVENEATQGSK